MGIGQFCILHSKQSKNQFAHRRELKSYNALTASIMTFASSKQDSLVWS